MKTPRKVVVVGSVNVDISLRVTAMPAAGETVFGSDAVMCVGGKGANQAAAAAACGATTRFIARVGADVYGGMIRSQLSERGVQVDLSEAPPGTASGLALICVEPDGQNRIVVVSGANDLLKPDDLGSLTSLLDGTSIVVLQCETPVPTVERAIELAAARGATVILNLAPFRPVNLASLARHVTYLIVNETEAAQLTGMTVATLPQATQCASMLQAKGTACVILTLGALGCVVADEHGTQHLAAHKVATIDTTGAGDAFVGCLAASLAAGHSRLESVKRANLYAALSTTRLGAQVSLPREAELDAAWVKISGPQG
jgi:ribokinase